jgi:phosphomannomutase
MNVEELMQDSGVKFGTSGARGLAADMTDEVCMAYTSAFLRYLEESGQQGVDDRVALAGDLRPSTERILQAVARAVRESGHVPVHCGRIPSPAVALYGIREGIPAVMVTGSHIPEDRNGIKYNKPAGEILKEDEAGMMAQEVLPSVGNGNSEAALGPVHPEAEEAYLERWLDAFPAGFLTGCRIGLYQHSAVGRDLLERIYTGLGAEVTPLDRSERFVPVDTEAIREKDVEKAAAWAREHGFDTILSTDGDGDRPLISDEQGRWFRGDVAGILCAQFCGADTVVTPVSCNTAVERCGAFERVRRTRIGSPFVVAGMIEEVSRGGRCVVGYEANGGFLTATDVRVGDRVLSPLPTRDPVIVHLALLGLAREKNLPLSELSSTLPSRFTHSDRIQGVPPEESQALIQRLLQGGPAAIEETFPELGPAASLDITDGLRITFLSGEIVHIRPSGNAPELRCYTEADTASRAATLNRTVLGDVSHQFKQLGT